MIIGWRLPTDGKGRTLSNREGISELFHIGTSSWLGFVFLVGC